MYAYLRKQIVDQNAVWFCWHIIYQVVPKERFHNLVMKNGVGLTHASMGMSSAIDGPADGTNLSGVGEIGLIPDITTKCIIPW